MHGEAALASPAAVGGERVDADADGFGADGDPILSCEEVTGYIDNPRDCDDGNPDINPDAEEVCDGVDNRCAGEIDVGAVDSSP